MEPDRADSSRRQHRLACIALNVLWAIVLMVIVSANLNGRWGSGMRLAATAGSLFIGGFVTLFWFVLFAPLRRRIRWGTFAALIAVGATLVAMFRLEEVSGGLRPRFVFRWSPPADQRLDSLPLMSSDSAAAIDLRTVSENDYPRFLGPDLTQSIDGVRFDTNWSETPPRCVWRQPIGAGWSSFVSINGYAVTQEQRGDQESVTCVEITSGKLVWTNSITTRHETRLGGVGPRSTPCVDEGCVYAIGATGIFRCLDGSTGVALWRHDLLDIMHVQNDEQEIAWGRAGSPLIVDQTVVVPVGGPKDGQKTSLIAFDKRTGHEVWRAGNRQISYASPTRAKLLSTDQIIIVLEDYVSSFDVHSHELLWEYPWPGRSDTNANVSNAVPLTDSHVFLSKGYGEGAELLQLHVDAMGRWNASSVWKQPVMLKTKFSNIVTYEGHIYGLNDVILECVEITTGRRCWKRGRFGYGQLMRVGSTLIVLSENGELAAVEATPERFIEHGRFVALDGKCWSHLCAYGPFLLIRNATEAACYTLPNWRRDTSPPIDANTPAP